MCFVNSEKFSDLFFIQKILKSIFNENIDLILLRKNFRSVFNENIDLI